MILTLLGPLVMSFEKKIHFVSKWKRFLIADLIMMLLFIPWDIIFTDMGIWSFNPDYYLGLKIANLPLEEWLFFIVVPFACYFVFENVNYFIKSDYRKFGQYMSLVIVAMHVLILISGIGGLYTVITFSLNSLFLLLTIKKSWIGKFHIAYLISGVPFAIVNGVLTAKPVVMYNNSENLNFRLGTIPFEDFFYGMLFMLIIVWICKKRS